MSTFCFFFFFFVRLLLDYAACSFEVKSHRAYYECNKQLKISNVCNWMQRAQFIMWINFSFKIPLPSRVAIRSSVRHDRTILERVQQKRMWWHDSQCVSARARAIRTKLIELKKEEKKNFLFFWRNEGVVWRSGARCASHRVHIVFNLLFILQL